MSGYDWLPGADLHALDMMRGVPVLPVPRPAERAWSWRICENCQTELLVEPGYADWLFSMGESAPPLYCERCKAAVMREEQRKPVTVNARCVHVDLQRGPFSELVITKVDGDRITVSVLGLGGTDPERQAEMTGRWWPAIMRGRCVFSRNELLMRGL